MTQASSQPTTKRFTFQTLILLLIPVILLAGVIALFLSTGGGLDLEAPVPVENLSVERYHLERNMIELQVQNTGPEELTVASVIINEAVMPSCCVWLAAHGDVHEEAEADEDRDGARTAVGEEGERDADDRE